MLARTPRPLLGIGLSVLAICAVPSASLPAHAGAPRAEAAPRAMPVSEDPAFAALSLSDAQRQQIEALQAREAHTIETLRRSLAATELELRRTELGVPFEAARVNALIARQVELRGYLRGAESRLVSGIAALLSDAQRRGFEALREGGPRGERPAAALRAGGSDEVEA